MLILASNSVRRQKLLKDIGLEFKIIQNDVTENLADGLSPQECVMSISKQKAEAALQRYPDDTIIAADTLVYFKGEKLGKPVTEEQAYIMLKKIAGQEHKVYTGVTIINKDKVKTFFESTSVYMKPYNDIQIYDYIKTQEPLDKAGAYAIQGLGEKLVDYYEGDFFTIVGLPIKQLQKELKEFDY